MSKKNKAAHLDADSLYAMGDAVTAQHAQLDSLNAELGDISKSVDTLDKNNSQNAQLAAQADLLLHDYLAALDQSGTVSKEDLSLLEQPTAPVPQGKAPLIRRTQTISTGNSWEAYLQSARDYAEQQGIDLHLDPFSTSLSQRQYEELSREINDEFSQKTSICNKIDLNFLAVATALQVIKSLLYPVIAGQLGFGQESTKKMAHDDPRIKHAQKQAQDKFKQSHGGDKTPEAEWLNILRRTPPYDITTGTKGLFSVGLSGRTHRVHTLGHDPILGWVVGTSNILTDTVTFDKTYAFSTYRVSRIPKMSVTSEYVMLPHLVSETWNEVQADRLNLPAALAAQAIHLKSDQYTTMGLPVPLLSSINPSYAAELYKQQYDAMCALRDGAIIGTSALLSLGIDAIIGLIHGLFYKEGEDGTRRMYEVRTRKILLISGAIASASNIVEACILRNPKALDIGGLLVTASKLFTMPGFILDVKREFIENKIYQNLESELAAIEQNQDSLLDFEFTHRAIIGG